MIITRTPFRVSFFGGGTDHPEWYKHHSGAVLSTTINKYCYLSCRKLPPFFDHKYRIVYSKIETVSDIDDIIHPSAREVIRWSGVKEGLEIHHDGDLPARSGLGSSSSFTVGLINLLYAYQGKMVNARRLANDSIHIEQDVIGESVGSQDQVAAAYGGLNLISFNKDGDIGVRPVVASNDRMLELESHLLLFYSGISRFSSDISKDTVSNIGENEASFYAISEMVNEGVDILAGGNSLITDFGGLLNDHWRLKKTLSRGITSPVIDNIYEEAMCAGAIGGKLLGAGGGGFILFFAPPKNHDAIKKRLKKLIYVPFKMENSGSRVVMYNPEGL